MAITALAPPESEVVRPHEVIEFTLERLQFGAVIVTSFEQTVLYANQRALDVFPLMQPETSVEQAFKSFGWDWDTSAIGRLIEGPVDEDITYFRQHSLDEQTLFTVASWLPEAVDWPPCALVTTHFDNKLSHRAVEVHERDRLAVVQAILLDQMITEQRELAAAAVRSYRKTNDVLRTHMQRMAAMASELSE